MRPHGSIFNLGKVFVREIAERAGDSGRRVSRHEVDGVKVTAATFRTDTGSERQLAQEILMGGKEESRRFRCCWAQNGPKIITGDMSLFLSLRQLFEILRSPNQVGSSSP